MSLFDVMSVLEWFWPFQQHKRIPDSWDVPNPQSKVSPSTYEIQGIWQSQQQEKPTMQIEHYEHFIINADDYSWHAEISRGVASIRIRDKEDLGDLITLPTNKIKVAIEILTALKANVKGE